MPDVKEALTRKIGPLPAWGWGIAVGGGALAVKMLRGGSGNPRETLVVPTGAPQPAPDFVSGLGTRLDEIGDRLDWIEQNTNTNTDDGSDVPSPTNKPPANAAPTSGLYVARFVDFLRINEGRAAANRFVDRFLKRGQESRAAAVRRASGRVYDAEKRGNDMLKFILRRGGLDAAKSFAGANRRRNETLAQAFNRLFGTPLSQIKPPDPTGNG